MRKNICICLILIFLLVNGYSQAIQDQSLNPKEDPEINALLEDISLLSKSSEMPKRIELLNNALTKITKDNWPEKWAELQIMLAISLYQNPFDERAENLEQVIEHCKLALQVYTRENFPEDWARIQNCLAAAYSNRIRGDRVENLEKAIEYCKLALQVRTREDFPEDWAGTQNNLAAAYIARIRGDRVENLEKVMKHYELALQVYTRENYPERWAMIQNNLAAAYSERIRGDRAENLEKAMKHYELALQVYTREDFPEDWAKIQNNLAVAYNNRIRGDRAENLEQAIGHCNLALQVRTREDFPEDWARSQNNLAAAYSDRIRGDRAKNLEQAIEHCQFALQIHTREKFLFEYVKTSIDLGKYYFEKSQWDDVCQVCSVAEEAGEDLIALAVDEEIKAKYLSDIQDAFSYHAYALGKLGKYNLALKVLEKGKTRSLNQALFYQRIRSSDIDHELQKKFNKLHQEIFNIQQQLKRQDLQEDRPYTELTQELRIRQEEMKKIYQKVKKQVSLETLDNWNVDNLIKKYQKAHAALIIFNVTPSGTQLLVSSPNKSKMTSIFINEFTSEKLQQITLQDPEKQSPLKSWLEVFPQNTQDWKNWCQHQPKILAKLGQWLWPKLDKFLQQEKILRVVLVPQGKLFLYPLHATPFISLRTNDKKRIYPIERYTITYAPSLRLYDQLAKTDTINLRDKNALFVEDPDGTWDFSFARQKWLSQKMKNLNLGLVSLQKSEIAAEEVLKHMKDTALFHYYGHGHYDFMHPEESGLKMYSPEEPWNLLTMSKISQTLNPKPMDMVVLIACETAITDVFSPHWRDQFMGLPAGFLRSGANIVVGSLWPVPLDETSLIFIHFYKELLSEEKGISPAEALRQAQLWMLNASRREIRLAKREYMGSEAGDANKDSGPINDSRSNPVNWAAFYVVGNGFAVFE